MQPYRIAPILTRNTPRRKPSKFITSLATRRYVLAVGGSRAWGDCHVVVFAGNESQLTGVSCSVQDLGVVSHLVCDLGRHQIYDAYRSGSRLAGSFTADKDGNMSLPKPVRRPAHMHSLRRGLIFFSARRYNSSDPDPYPQCAEHVSSREIPPAVRFGELYCVRN